MNKLNARLLKNMIAALIGAALFILGAAGKTDNFFCGFGAALFFAEVFMLLRFVRYKNDAEYARKVTVRNTDERNLHFARKARGDVFNISMVAGAAAIIILRILGYNEASTIVGTVMCGELVLYFVLYYFYILRR